MHGEHRDEDVVGRVAARHTSELMGVPGVEGVGIAEVPTGLAIRLYVTALTPEVRARLPRVLEGVPVVLQEVGEIRALTAD